MVELVHRVNLESRIKRILFVQPLSGYATGFNDTVCMEALGPEYLAGGVAEVAECQLADLRVPDMDIVEQVQSFQPDLVAVQCGYTTDVPVVADIARQVKQLDARLPVVVGGHHISLAPEDLFIPEVDIILKGEADQTFPLLVRQLGTDGRVDRVPNLYYRDGTADFRSTVPPPRITNLVLHDDVSMNERSAPLRRLSDPYRDYYYFLYHTRPYSVETARGCRYRCSFCSVWQFHQGAYRVEGWQRSLRNICAIPDGSYVNIVDDLAIQVMPHEDYRESDAWRLANALIESGNHRRFWMQCRADNVVRNPELYARWAEAGLDMVLIGLESDDPAELKRVNKGSRPGVNVEAVQFLHSVGVKIWGAQIVFTDWSHDRFDRLIEYNRRLRIDCPQFTIHTPLPGTPDWRRYEHELTTHDRRHFDCIHPVLPTTLPRDEFMDRYVRLYRDCYMSFRELMNLARNGGDSRAGLTAQARRLRRNLRRRPSSPALGTMGDTE